MIEAYIHDRGPMCVGDLNGDGEVDAADEAILMFNRGHTCSPADLDGDGSVDSDDLTILQANIGTCD